MMSRRANNTPPNVYLASYRDFRAIPGTPWVYWIPEGIRRLFRDLPKLGDVAEPVVGLRTSDNFRFLRYWWEVGLARIAFDCRDRSEARSTGKRWFPHMKGGAYRKWYGNQEYVVNWQDDGTEISEAIMQAYPYLGRPWLGGINYYFREGVTWSDLSSKAFGVRYLPPGFVFDVKGSSGFPKSEFLLALLGIMNSPWITFALVLLNPTVSFQVGDISRVPVPPLTASKLERLDHLAVQSVRLAWYEATLSEPTFDFIAPPRWDTGIEDLAAARACLRELEAQIDEAVYRIYGISGADRAAIEEELGSAATDGEDEPPLTRQELARHWISYAVGIVMGRFRPGLPRTREPHARGPLGRAVFHPNDFAVGSLPPPNPEEFDELVGPAERFAHIDEEGGRHLFPADVEEKLRQMADPDGIMVLDEGHPDDLPARVEEALTIMLGDEQAQQVIATLIGEEIPDRQKFRRFMEREFFSKHHIKMYRKRPIYWLLQTANKNYGFYIFHERIDKDTLYKLQRNYIDPKLNWIVQQIKDLTSRISNSEGPEKRRLEKEREKLEDLYQEIKEFASKVDKVLNLKDENGKVVDYDPDINDGVILNMAPLHELIPWNEPAKYWKELKEGRYDWAHIAMRYWPNRVREKCKKDKSLAIAHGVGE